MPVQTQLQQRRGTAASWTSTNPTLAAGEIGFESDTGKIKIGNGSTAWNALAYTASSTAVTYLYNATAAQTTFSGADANSLTLAYTVGSEQVYLNGVLQVRGSDYTATNGTSIVLVSGALVNDVLNVIAFSALALSDTYTQAQADAKFFQTANAFLAGKNKIINGDFYINQRAFTSTTTDGAFTFDRWTLNNGGGFGTFTAETFTLGAAPVAGYEGKNFIKVSTAGASGAGQGTTIFQRIEDVRTLAGQTATVSFWAKADSGTPSVSLELIQNFGTGGSPSASVTAIGVTKFSITSSWARYSATVSIPSISGKTIGTDNNSRLQPIFWTSAGSDNNARTNSLGIQNANISFWGVQVEAGSVATPFQTATGTIQGELAACQRYYYRITPTANGQKYTVGSCETTTAAELVVPFPVSMRIAPTALEQSGTATDYSIRAGATVTTCNGTPVFLIGTTNNSSIYFYVASGLTVGQIALGRVANTNGFLGWSAEL